MPLVLRKIRKSKWYKHEGVAWLAEGELQSDALTDLSTNNNELSVWYIKDDKSNLARIVAALAANSDHVSNLDYALFNEQVLSEIGIKVEKRKGATIDEEANTSWHCELVELSASRLMELAKAILTKAEKKRVQEKEVRELIKQSLNSGHIDKTKLKTRV